MYIKKATNQELIPVALLP